MPHFGQLHYMKFHDTTLLDCVTQDLSKQAMRLYIYYALNWVSYTEYTSEKSDTEIAEDLQVHRTTILRARAELEKSGLVVPSQKTLNQTHSYHLPHLAKINSEARQRRTENEKKDKERAYVGEKQNIENVLGRRLNDLEKRRLREKHSL